ncbi:hypothetical protein [Microbacterium sp. SORGH_AS_0888]|uniref:hypothetical protein n=1 Tax=Microbacterium sp. SORGH_AS_0888 TaxID=3041791 RepID=UPI002789F350|nr:hypothetical protein [Microbacterium sp. SORGH_AS_0888]MDQ1130410.1 hypothetical protein [Microbacterium sp. SORGH_AS_0888]
MYPVRQALSSALAQIEDARGMYPDGPVVLALDALQDAVSQLCDLVQDLEEERRPPRNGYVRTRPHRN